MDHERCTACGFDGGRYDSASLLEALRALGPRWRVLLADAGPNLGVRPAPKTWSALEYAAHSADVTALHVFGVEQALTGDEPSYPAIDGDDLIESAAAGYSVADPESVLGTLQEASTRLADLAHDAGPDAWGRGLSIGGSRSDVRQLLEHALHDSLHHVDDVERGLVMLTGERPSSD